jgi:hypothetical protein
MRSIIIVILAGILAAALLAYWWKTRIPCGGFAGLRCPPEYSCYTGWPFSDSQTRDVLGICIKER